jgi:squalene-hopene/tetraprenyl-beta-curcumene cyclase
MKMIRSMILTGVAGLLVGSMALPVIGADAAPAAATVQGDSGAAVKKAEGAIEKSLAYLKAQQQADGGWQKKAEPPAITALVLRTMLLSGKYTDQSPEIRKGFDKLLSYQLDNGGIFKDLQGTYNTAIAITALTAAKDPKYQTNVDKAVAYLKSLQWTDAIQGLPSNVSKIDESNANFGGWGYSAKKGRADGSNLQMAMEALHESGLPQDDPAYKNAQKFLTRMQNLSETNDQPWTSNDGGFIYTPGNKGESMAGEYVGADGRRLLRSYGSMTYAGLKSMIYAGLSKNDPRVKAAWEWIRKNYTVDVNPGMQGNSPKDAEGGLYYYYTTMARALRVWGEPIITDAQGNKHDWRVELIDKIASLQKEDGSWQGMDRFMENNPTLATCFAMLALEEAVADLKEHPAR